MRRLVLKELLDDNSEKKEKVLVRLRIGLIRIGMIRIEALELRINPSPNLPTCVRNSLQR
jgi:hypothetical protein